MDPTEPVSRSPKRLKMDHAQSSSDPRPRKGNAGKPKYRAQKTENSRANSRRPAVISASGIHSDDVGIFVTCDKGQEKKCLQELSDLLEELFAAESSTQPVAATPDVQPDKDDVEVDIEADIRAELDSLRSKREPPNVPSAKLSFITLDIPCVSFVRFPKNPPFNPVETVRKLCLSASSKEEAGPRSRYIKRLTPVSLMRKTLNDGLQSLCDEVLPKHFLIDVDSDDRNSSSKREDEHKHQPCKFAIRPTIRNNHKLNRDEVIRVVADKIATLGRGEHTVDLKGYDKLVLVEVYRNVIGMSVVGNEFETLKRFNLAEIHASHFDDGDKKGTNDQS
ncbi:uncharacterized protein PV07_07687 [Cladophialophora immunda]|uniref:THUMP domain-containing protein n=1 Tax=Cladophialophora immunda TaxID=569365 RepID=A0A0D2CCD9_9EURO|nr:uncharacterized protein PV07_07687 [Cladophialophora immunda]KIW27995.1 hypothetical protein PV07_07687 [Cladophialophora immunda]OQV02521.1 THUMP domain-containing protein [Cladophialophora immunda]